MGYQGLRGPIGRTGAQGSQGLRGPRGFQGFQGFMGVAGSQGVQGFIGLQGPTGAQGAQGPSGVGLGGIIPYSTNGIYVNQPQQNFRFLYTIGFGNVGAARFGDTSEIVPDVVYTDVSFSLPRATTLRRLTVTVTGRVGTAETAVPTVTEIVGSLIYRIYVAIPDDSQFIPPDSWPNVDKYRGTDLFVTFAGNNSITTPRTETSALMSLSFPMNTDIALVVFSTNALTTDPNYALDTNVTAGLLYD